MNEPYYIKTIILLKEALNRIEKVLDETTVYANEGHDDRTTVCDAAPIDDVFTAIKPLFESGEAEYLLRIAEKNLWPLHDFERDYQRNANAGREP